MNAMRQLLGRNSIGRYRLARYLRSCPTGPLELRAAALFVVLVSGCTTSNGPAGTVEVRPSLPTPASSTPTPASSTSSSRAPFHVTPPGDLFVEGGVEFIEWLVACAAENGEIVEPIYGASPAVAWTGTRERTRQILEQCRETGLSEGWIVPTPFDGSAEGNRLMYRLWIPVYECLRDQGYPTVEPPSEEAFVDRGSELWNPYSAMAGAPLVVADPDAASAAEVRQLEAQELCGASAEVLYQEELQEH